MSTLEEDQPTPEKAYEAYRKQVNNPALFPFSWEQMKQHASKEWTEILEFVFAYGRKP